MPTWTDIAEEDQYMVMLAPQTALNTPGTVWEVIECNVFVPQDEQSQVDTPRGAQIFGAWMPPIPGKTWHRLALKGPVKGQPGGYDFTTDSAALHGLSRFLEFLGGQSAIAYQGTGVELTGSDAMTVILKTTSGKMGCLLASRDTVSGEVTHGFITSLAGGGPFTAGLHDDLGVAVTDDAGRLPTLTCYPKRAALTNVAYTVRIVFGSTNQDRRYMNFVPTGVMRLLVEEDVLMWEVPGIALAPETYNGGDGALVALTDLLAMDAHLAASRYVLRSHDSDFGDDLLDGTVDPSGSCGIRDVILNIDFRESFKAKGPATGGVCDNVMRAPLITAELAVPTIASYNEDPSPAENILLASYKHRRNLSLSAYHGNAAGKLLAWRFPYAHLAGRPRRVFIEGVEHFVGTLRAGPWTGDGTSDDGGNKVLDIGVG
ncbi:MAG: hypothetical protein IT385_18980 [Deltaproteobacteria bacterium]|nr:hypothetical protein [Deltaproteobacteria bacterium]